MNGTDQLRTLLGPVLERATDEEKKEVQQAIDRVDDTLALLEGKVRQAIRDRVAASSLLKKTSADLLRRYMSLFEYSGIPLVVIGEDGIISLANQYFEQLAGVSRDEMRGVRNFQDFIEPSQLPHMIEFHYARRRGDPDVPRYYETLLVTSTGEVRNVAVSINLFPDTSESVISILDLTENIQSRIELLRHKERLEAVLLVYQMYWAEISEIAQFSLEKAIQLTGSTAGTLVRAGTSPGDPGDIWTIGWGEGAPAAESAIRLIQAALGSGEVIRFNSAGASPVSPVSQPVFRFLTVPIFEDGMVICAVCVAGKEKDYSDLDLLPITVLFSAMWRMVSRKEQADAIEAANKKLNLLSSVTRHDVRNKLTALIGYLELAREVGPDSSAHAVFTGKALLTARGINDLIEFTREYQEIGVRSPCWQHVGETFRRAAATISESRVRFSVDITDLYIFADPLLEKVFYNLLENAVRHGGHVTQVRVFAQTSGSRTVIVVEDDGTGILLPEKEKIFSRAYGKNTGFGLFLSREVLSMTGLSIAELGNPGRGARFEITVPEGSYRIGPLLPRR